MKISTKTGDQGETSINQQRVSKSSQIIDSLGNLDELMATLIVFANQFPQHKKNMKAIVHDCSEISAILAQYHEKDHFDAQQILWLEKEMDTMELQQFSFVYPFDDLRKAKLNQLRTMVRRVERSLWTYHEQSFMLSSSILIYFNRLSDYIYLLSVHE